jgi:hypothetical protein
MNSAFLSAIPVLINNRKAITFSSKKQEQGKKN